MCPLCIATAALAIVGTTSAGGLVPLAVNKLFRAQDGAKNNPELESPELKSKENRS
jgi:hypothetical protein